ncbi:flagellin [Paracoccus sp. M683]|uniref:flagellin n=1 Tax=Paracoccus sp. M683 TaxID=2594268 RepID=UPI0011805CAC|nr:flagellin [Paracoccus sp. M683]TRW96063.1 flagellin [Paracoccus sp. M683]
MSSILTNNGAIVALQTLKGINANLLKTQNEISTGKSIGNAKDNAAIWAISKTMETDISGFKAISTNLNTAGATVATARSAVEKIQEALDDVKTLVLTAQTAGADDRAKLQTDIEGFRDVITSIVSTAQFNGVNLLDGTSTATYDVLSSLNRSGGTVTPSRINVDRQDMSMNAGVAATFGGTAVTNTSIIDNDGTAAGTAATLAAGGTQTLSIASVGSGYSYRITLDDTAGANTLGAQTFEYVAGAGDSTGDIANQLGQAIEQHLSINGITTYSVTRVGDEIRLQNNHATDGLSVTAETATGGTPATGGGMAALATFDVTSDAGAASALTQIEGLMRTAIDAAAALGSTQKRIETQNDFLGQMSDLMTSGVGSLVDANMEEASARLQALQTQQQLGIQSLSIANQAPSSILALFRG